MTTRVMIAFWIGVGLGILAMRVIRVVYEHKKKQKKEHKEDDH